LSLRWLFNWSQISNVILKRKTKFIIQTQKK
jgi:hypothetical protein